MAADRVLSPKWLFTRDQLENTPSRRCGIEADRELSYRQQAANLIQDIGQRLNVSQLIINTAIVYMHRFYMVHSFSRFHRNVISQTTLFLAAKVEEQPRKLEHVIKIAHAFISPQEPALDTKSNAFQLQAQELVTLESIVLQTLGFEITVDHPHTDVVRCSQLVRASRDLAQTSYFMATNSLHLTTFCLQHRPTVVACVCIHLACKWSNWEIPVSTDGKPWWEYVDRGVTLQLLDELTHEFLQILERTPSKLKRIRNWRAIQAAKKPKTDGSGLDSPYLGGGLDTLPAVAGSFFPSTSVLHPGGVDALGAPYSLYQNLSDQFSQPPHSDFTLLKPKHKGGGGGSGSSRSHKVLTLEKYREKQSADLHNGSREESGGDAYAASAAAASSHHHRKHDSRRDKPSSKKQRLPAALADPAPPAGEELKMRIKVSERPSGRHKSHRHSKHAGGRAAAAALENGCGRVSAAPHSDSGSSRKRPHSDNHYLHTARSARASRAGLSSGPFPQEGGQSRGELQGRLLLPNGQHTDYKNTFDMLDSLLSAQGMNL